MKSGSNHRSSWRGWIKHRNAPGWILGAGVTLVLGGLLLCRPFGSLSPPLSESQPSIKAGLSTEIPTPYPAVVTPAGTTATLPPVHPTARATISFTSSPTLSFPTGKALENLNCRIGPGMDYRILARLPRGAVVPILGQDPYHSWWLVRIPDSSTECWIAAILTETSGDTDDIRIVEPPPLGCLVKGNNHIDVCLIPCPENVKTEGVCSP